MQIIVQRLMTSQDILKLLYYTTDKKCLEQDDIVDNTTLTKIASEYISVVPRIDVIKEEKSVILISFNNFSQNSNPKFIDCSLSFDVICPRDHWTMDSYMLRPFRIMQSIKELFDQQKLSGIGTAQFLSADLLNLDEYIGYQLTFAIIHDR